MLRIIRRAFKVMNREEYRENQKIASLLKKVNTYEMPDLLASDGGPLHTEEKLVLSAVPEVAIKPDTLDSDPFYSVLYEHKPELIFLQFNPMPYIVRQRYVAYQRALTGDDDYSKKSVYSYDNPIPLS